MMKQIAVFLILLIPTIGILAQTKDDCDCPHPPWSPECFDKCYPKILSTATREQLVTILGFDQTTADRILSMRGGERTFQLKFWNDVLTKEQLLLGSRRIKSLTKEQLGGVSAQIRKHAIEQHYYVGLSQLRDNNLKTAIDNFNIAVELDPQEPLYHESLGRAYISQGRKDQAVESLDQTVALADFDPSLYSRLAQSYSEIQASGKINLIIQRAEQHDPDVAAKISYSAAAALYSAGNLMDAVPFFEKSVNLSPENAEASFYLGITLLEARKVDPEKYGAVASPANIMRLFQRYIELKPKGPLAGQTQKYIAYLDVVQRNEM